MLGNNTKGTQIKDLRMKVYSNQNEVKSLEGNIKDKGEKIKSLNKDIKINEVKVKVLDTTNYGFSIFVLLTSFINFLKGTISNDILIELFCIFMLIGILCLILSSLQKKKLLLRNVDLQLEIESLNVEINDCNDKVDKLKQDIIDTETLIHNLKNS